MFAQGYRRVDATMLGRSLRSSGALSQREHFSQGWLFITHTVPGVLWWKTEE